MTWPSALFGLVLGLPLFALFSGVKNAAAASAIAILVVIWAVVYRRIASWATALRRVALAGGLFGAAFVVIFKILIWWSPPVTPDGHGVMAIGQTFGATLLAAVVAIIFLASRYRNKPKFSPREESDALAMAIAFTAASATWHYLRWKI